MTTRTTLGLRFVPAASTPRPRYAHLDSPVGELLALSDGRALCGLFLDRARHVPELPAGAVRDDDALSEVARQLDAYFAGERRGFDLEVAPVGTPFQLDVWRALAQIPYGTTNSYGEVAQRVGRPGAARAVGSANNRNPISIVVPCHRVIGASGALTGYAGGLDRKVFLLELEKRVAGP